MKKYPTVNKEAKNQANRLTATCTVVNTEKKVNKDEEDGGKDSSEQEDATSKNIRR